ncbi:MAG: chorismate-binding protein, partial [Methanomicrobiales archaeon]|nr:chorismate-binding protein [Methanomicrobiales archaeon]
MRNPEDGEINLNLCFRDYSDAVEHQAKPLVIPLCAELPVPALSPPALFSRLHHATGFLLESMEGSEKIARYSYIGFDPELLISFGSSIHREGKEPCLSISQSLDGANAIEMVKSLLQRFTFINIRAPRFFGGLVGYFSYDLAYSLYDPVLKTRKSPADFPVAQFMLVKDCIVLDQVAQKLFIFSSPLLQYESDIREEYEQSRERIHQMADTITKNGESDIRTPSVSRFPHKHTENMSKEKFCHTVEQVKEYIRAGDIFQAVVSRRIDLDLDIDPFSVYCA